MLEPREHRAPGFVSPKPPPQKNRGLLGGERAPKPPPQKNRDLLGRNLRVQHRQETIAHPLYRSPGLSIRDRCERCSLLIALPLARARLTANRSTSIVFTHQIDSRFLVGNLLAIPEKKRRSRVRLYLQCGLDVECVSCRLLALCDARLIYRPRDKRQIYTLANLKLNIVTLLAKSLCPKFIWSTAPSVVQAARETTQP